MYINLTDRPTEAATATAPRSGSAAPAGAGTRRVAPVVITLGVVSLLTDISSESVSAILPLYLTGVLGLSTIAYGFIDGLYQGVSALVRIAGGWAADRGGHPKWVAFAGYGISCLARVGFLFATGMSTITAAVSADRIGKGIRTAPRDAMISAATDPAHLGRAFGVHRTLDTIGAVIGPLAAFLILWWIPDGYHTVFVVSLGCAVLGVALLGLAVTDPTTRTPRPRRGARGDTAAAPFSWRQLTNPRLRMLLVTTGVLGLLTVGDGFIYLALLDRGEFAVHWFPLMYVGTNIAYLSLAIPLGRLADRVGRARVLVLGHLTLVAAYLCAAAPLPSAPGTVLALLLLGTFYAATDGVIAALAGRLVASSARASGIASAQTVVALARLVSSSAFGVLWFVLGPARALVLVGSALLMVIPAALLVLTRLDREVVPA